MINARNRESPHYISTHVSEVEPDRLTASQPARPHKKRPDLLSFDLIINLGTNML